MADVTPMTDEQLGRAWAAQQGYAPNAPTAECPYWFWNPGDAPDLPWQLYDALPRPSEHATDGEAFAALGVTVRTLQSLVPPLKDASPSSRFLRAALAEDGMPISAGVRPTLFTLADAEVDLANAVYAATAILERLEHAGKVLGNGHHARQAVARMAVEELRRRWQG